jgi:cysteine desulfurase
LGVSNSPRVYLDHAATTPLHPAARAALEARAEHPLGNPSASNAAGRAARRILEDARERLAEVLGVDPTGVVFTSGGTEADNMAVLGRVEAVPGTVVLSALEHLAVAEPAARASDRPASVVPVTASGLIDLDALRSVLDPAVTLVSVMTVNNETGTVQPLEEVAVAVRELASAAAFHTDAVQALNWVDLRPIGAMVDLMSISGHKFGAPLGIGALVVRPGVAVQPRQFGGGQERERRAGTVNVAGVEAMAAAAVATDAARAQECLRLRLLSERLTARLCSENAGVVETAAPTGDRGHISAGHVHVTVEGVESEALLFLIDQAGVDASAAAACSSGALQPSRALAAMGGPEESGRGTVRFSLGRTTTAHDIERAGDAFAQAVRHLRSYNR